MSRAGIELCIAFGQETNRRHLCGRPEAQEAFNQYLTTHDNEEEVKKQLRQFEGLPHYLEVIAEANNKDWLDEEVVEAYWIGNELLDNLEQEHLEEIVMKLFKRGFPERFVENRISHITKGLHAHHDFNVFFMGVGLTSGNLEPTIYSMEMCRINYGKVIEIKGGNLTVSTNKIDIQQKKILIEEDTRTVVYNKELIQPIPGDYVAIHWGIAPIILTKKQVENLERYTTAIRETLNSMDDWLLTI